MWPVLRSQRGWDQAVPLTEARSCTWTGLPTGSPVNGQRYHPAGSQCPAAGWTLPSAGQGLAPDSDTRRPRSARRYGHQQPSGTRCHPQCHPRAAAGASAHSRASRWGPPGCGQAAPGGPRADAAPAASVGFMLSPCLRPPLTGRCNFSASACKPLTVCVSSQGEPPHCAHAAESQWRRWQ